MNYNKLLINFMWEKQKILEKYGVNLPYMDKKVEEVMKKWDKNEAKNGYEKLKKNIYGNGSCGLEGAVCPFCIIHDKDCDECEYAVLKGACSMGENNMWDKIHRFLKGEILNILSFEIYIKIINKIENQEK